MSDHLKSVCVVGAGAVGGVLACRLAQAGLNVRGIARGEHLSEIRARGLTLVDERGRSSVHALAAADQAGEFGVQELVLIALKGHDLPRALPALKPLVGPETLVLSAMNGVPWWWPGLLPQLPAMALSSVDPGGAIAQLLLPRRTIASVVHFGATRPAPGVVRLQSPGELVMGALAGEGTDVCAALAARLAEAGQPTRLTPRIADEVWRKLIGNTAVNSVTALTQSTVDRAIDRPGTHAIMARIVDEMLAIGRAMGIVLDTDGPRRLAMARALGAFKTSMLQDLEAGRQLEIDALLSAPLELANALEVPAPTIAMVSELLRLRVDQ